MSLPRRLANITLDNLDDLPGACRRCVFWELDAVAGDRAERAGDPGLEKEAWVSAALLEWGSCGKICYVDSRPAGFILYAPPAAVPRSGGFPTSPVSADAVLLMTARIEPRFAGAGLGRLLIQSAASDLVKRHARALEAFGRPGGRPGDQAAGRLGDRPRDPGRPAGSCLIPADFLLAVGFKTARPHPRYPRLRLELKNTVSWKDDVEAALERLLGPVVPEGAFARSRITA